MRKLAIGILAAFGSVALAGAVAACSSHGTAAGNHFSSWVASNAGGSTGIGVTGSVQAQGNQGGGAGSNGWANDSYWIDITMPDGTTAQVKTNSSDWASTSMSGQLEAYLFEAAQEKLNIWFNNYEPLDTAGDDYTG